MRVTSNSSNEALIARLQTLANKQSELQSRASTGQKFEAADADPAGLAQALRLQEAGRLADQFQTNIERHQSRAAASHNAINGLKRALDRAQEIAVLADGVTSAETMRTYAAEVGGLIERAIQFANSKHGEEYLFAGTRGDKAPFQVVAAPAGGVASVNFVGVAEIPKSEIAEGALVSSHIPGANPAGAGPRGLLADSRHGADLFSHLIALQKSLETGDANAIANSREALKADEETILYHVTSNAALQSTLESSAKMADRGSLQAKAAISAVADADLAETLLQLNQNQTAYQAALQSAARGFDLTLLNYIR
ncbi:MAG TPA: hypothetical protein VEH27_19635 [Methylomirabilota bacterium]|nr:hypothetical protein [Methylomirabilota bacterium]